MSWLEICTRFFSGRTLALGLKIVIWKHIWNSRFIFVLNLVYEMIMKQSSRTNSFLEIVTTFWALILRLCAAYNNVFPTFVTPHKFGGRIFCARILLVVSHFNASFSLFDKPSCSSKPIIIIFATSVQFFIYKKLCDRMNGLYYVIWSMVSQYLQIDKSNCSACVHLRSRMSFQ
jgi:hypothetical protein